MGARVVLLGLLVGCGDKTADGEVTPLPDDTGEEGVTDTGCVPEVEACNGLDDDCDGLVDLDDPDLVDALVVYADGDGDGHGDPSRPSEVCTVEVGQVLEGEDCDDRDAAVHPGAEESCNGVDDDCDGLTDAEDDDLVDGETWYSDGDGDGFGDPDGAFAVCGVPSSGTRDTSDCDDANPDVNPDADEVCDDGVDDDCDGVDPLCTPIEGDVSVASSDIVINGGITSFGCFAAAGDLTGSGSADLVASTHFYGTVLVFEGLAAGDSLSGGDYTAALRGDGDLGHSMMVADLDGDGWDDVISLSRSGAEVHHGPVAGAVGDAVLLSESLLLGQCSEHHLALPDADGDGQVDVVVADDNGREIFVALGPITGDADLSEEAVGHITTGRMSTRFGDQVHSAGDLDGDGLDELVISDHAFQSGGGGTASEVAIVLGSRLDSELDVATADAVIRSTNTAFGWSVAGGQDVDGDGLDDLVVGATGGGSLGSGAVYLFDAPLSASQPSDAVASYTDASGDTLLGYDVAVAGDTDGDGHVDLLVGHSASSASATKAGVVYLFTGPHSGAMDVSVARGRVMAIADDDRLGHTVHAPGDVTGDGATDLMMTAEYTDELWIFAGTVP